MKTPAKTSIVVEGAHNRAFATYVHDKVAEALGLVDPEPVVAKVIFADENGPKGGLGVRCTIVSDMPRRREVSVTEVMESETIAFDAAFAALETTVTRDRARRRTLVRHPKKYYLAKRLLAPDTSLESPELRAESPLIVPTPRPKRARRRRVA